ncbi:hypothetical protein ALC56_08497 [Trachymyrmex septentrionalis]|uniref:Uncharacterized protein n=1 Tax=Trachymyrmex septentrionalis TaxID=34720 RepID=A0A195F8K4_9HYME|nr:hypothetical protein ALC56_08497 [Trachymyrmex septentrionalis]
MNFPAFVYAAISAEVLLYPCCSPNKTRMRLNALFRTICVLVHSGTTTFQQVVRETSRTARLNELDRAHHALERSCSEAHACIFQDCLAGASRGEQRAETEEEKRNRMRFETNWYLAD